MLFKSLAVFFFSLPWKGPKDRLPTWTGDLPPWERTPAEQRYRRKQAEEEASRWLRLPRGY